ncbi:hypothetical protein [Flavobacterium sp. UMI-01]|uniref:hypothetical protein n=1 Tax=Flavobacterium sp. UMI-01 TaxID=1441053 RepID=UPI001C7D9223|nr:hypothetical protein [Flavobacterium sp. UMI-01]GIZ07906.1 hypothetical protein FUMI01_06330 [Flavobacterium sp. UMI-01]
MTIQTNNAHIEQITFNNAEKLNQSANLYSNLTSSSNSNSTISNFIYVTGNNTTNNNVENLVKTGHTEVIKTDNETDFNSSFPLFFFQNIDTIYIPKKAKRHLEKNVPNAYLKAIDNDRTIAIEKCIVLLSSLSSTIYSEKRWKELSSTIMDTQTKKGNNNTRIYPKIFNVLKYNTNTTEGIVQVKTNSLGNETYQEGVSCKSYSLTDTFYNAGLTEYTIKDNDILQKRKKYFYTQLQKAQQNTIASNLIALYARIDLPTKYELLSEAKRLVKNNHKNKKGKTLTFLNKHPKSYFKNTDSRSFVEDNIKLFEFLTKRGYMIPQAKDKKAGGRVVDSFTLMPSWIRNTVKIDGESIVEVDYKALHPNIAMSIYGGSKKFLTHELVAEESGIAKNEVKIEHLSFFNKTPREMKHSKLYKYYESSEPQMLKAIEQEKWNSTIKHKITSMMFFTKEVEIMTECIKQLNKSGIYVGYVYDALFCKKSEAEIVKTIMDKVVLQCNVFTTAEINY